MSNEIDGRITNGVADYFLVWDKTGLLKYIYALRSQTGLKKQLYLAKYKVVKVLVISLAELKVDGPALLWQLMGTVEHSVRFYRIWYKIISKIWSSLQSETIFVFHFFNMV